MRDVIRVCTIAGSISILRVKGECGIQYQADNQIWEAQIYASFLETKYIVFLIIVLALYNFLTQLLTFSDFVLKVKVTIWLIWQHSNFRTFPR